MSNHPVTLSEQLEVISQFQKDSPIQMIALANALGVKVYESVYSDDFSGRIQKDREYLSPSGYTIIVNEHHPVTRRRFTIAHELAHFILHKDVIGDGVTDDALYRSGLSSRFEIEANKLAADILMPHELINKELENGVDTVHKLARIFNVSLSSMSIRLGIPCEA